MDMFLPLFSTALVLLPLHTAQPIQFQIGVILDLESPVGRIGSSCLSKAFNDFYNGHPDYKTRLVLNIRDSNGSVVDAADAGRSSSGGAPNKTPSTSVDAANQALNSSGDAPNQSVSSSGDAPNQKVNSSDDALDQPHEANQTLSSSSDAPNQKLNISGDAPNHQITKPPDLHPGMTCCFPLFPGIGIHQTLLCLVLVAWGLVGSLLNATYTASLSSRLTIQNLQPTVADTRLLIKNGDYVGCQEGSFVCLFLVKLGFDNAKIRSYKFVEDCDEDLTFGSKQGRISAYYDVSSVIKSILAQYCGKYMTVGPAYPTDGFAFAFPKDSPIVADISRAIVQLTENGTIQEIEQRFSASVACSAPESSTSSPILVTFQSFLVLFIFTGSITLACFIVSCLLRRHEKKLLLQRMNDMQTCFKKNDGNDGGLHEGRREDGVKRMSSGMR